MLPTSGHAARVTQAADAQRSSSNKLMEQVRPVTYEHSRTTTVHVKQQQSTGNKAKRTVEGTQRNSAYTFEEDVADARLIPHWRLIKAGPQQSQELLARRQHHVQVPEDPSHLERALAERQRRVLRILLLDYITYT